MLDVGLKAFLAAGKSREAEAKRINKELANIRSKFKGEGREQRKLTLVLMKYLLSWSRIACPPGGLNMWEAEPAIRALCCLVTSWLWNDDHSDWQQMAESGKLN